MKTMGWRIPSPRLSVLAGTLLSVLLGGCTGGQQPRVYSVATGGNVHRGRQLIARYRCGSCHTIPGVRNADGVFGPPLTRLASRTYLAGTFPNGPATLTQWIMKPQSMKPKTAMPDMGIQHQQARDITAFLETLR